MVSQKNLAISHAPFKAIQLLALETTSPKEKLPKEELKEAMSKVEDL